VPAKDETVTQHRNDAVLHLNLAKEEQSKAMSEAQRPSPRAPGSMMFGVPPAPYESYNPRDAHLQAADLELSKASEHLAAAKTLVTFEDKACAGLSEGARSACPLFASSVSLVETNQSGFKLTFWPHVDAVETFQRLNCHLAYATASGFDRPSCPLFLRGTTLRRASDHEIVFIGETAEIAEALRSQARRVFIGTETAAIEPKP
jgi:hypothetical protein